MATGNPQQGVSIALPIGGIAARGTDTPAIAGMLEQAIRCILRQTLQELDLMVVLNGADPHLHALVRTLAFGDSRVRMLELPEANLAAALNLALEHARFDLVARMDADDLCDVNRLEKQASHMTAHPSLAALGCAWELISFDGRTITVVRPPTTPEHLRWRLLLGNYLAHGSMMLRRQAILDAGGYNTACTRSQDYELWLRLAWSGKYDLACLPDVLYQYRTRYPGDPGRSTPQQAEIAAPVMLAAWQRLASMPETQSTDLARALASAISREAGPSGSTAALEELLARSPSKEALLAWLWAQWHHPPMHRRAAEICRLSRLREIGAELKTSGAKGIYLWGAGDHTRWILEHRDALDIDILGLIDDNIASSADTPSNPPCRFDLPVQPPAALNAGDCVLISSDWYEDQIWLSSEPHRTRGVQVRRMYA